MKKLIVEIAGKKYQLKEIGQQYPGYNPDDIGLGKWSQEKVEEVLTPAIKALYEMYHSKELNYMIYGEIPKAIKLLKKIIKDCNKKL
jgi:hypothetical protein